MIEIFQVLRSFGVHGGMKIRPYADDLSFYKKVYDATGKKYSLRVDGRKPDIIFFDEVVDRTIADTLRGQIFYVERDDLKPIEEDQFYICNLVGRTVSIEGSDLYCKIVSFQNYGAGDLVELEFMDKKFLIPFTKQNFPSSNFILSKEAFKGFIENVAS